MAPELPAMLSTTTGWPHAAWNFSANRRAVTSVALPGVKPTTSFTGLSGQVAVCAKAGAAAMTRKAVRVRSKRTIFFLPLSGRLWQLAPACQRAVFQPAQQADHRPEQQEIDNCSEHDRRRAVGDALRLAGLEQEFGHGDDAAERG